MMFSEFFNAAFAPLISMGPLFAVAGISLTVSFIFSLMYRVLVNQGTFKRIKAEQKELQQKMKNAQKNKDDKALKDLFSSSMSLQNRMMALTIKPLIASMIIFVVLIPWLSGTYKDAVFQLPFYFPLVGTEVGWLGIYIIVSLPATMLFRKILGVD